MRVKSIVKLSFFVQLSLCLGGGFQGAPVSAKPAAPKVSAQEQVFIDAVRDALQVSHRAKDEIWKGFDLNNYPLIYFTPHQGFSYALLFNYTDNEPPQGFLPVAGNTGIYEGLTVIPYPNPFHIYYPVGSAQGIVMDTSMSTVTLIHEAFHRYQLGLSFVDGGAEDNTEYDPEDVALAQLEQSALVKALGAKNTDEMKQQVHAFLNFRNARNQKHSESLTHNENTLEAIEGTAAYVEHRFSQVAYQEKIVQVNPHFYQPKEVLQQETVDMLSAPLDKGGMERFRYYMTGYAMAILLDRLESSSWQTEMESGATLVGLLQSASNYVLPASNELFQVLNTSEFKAQKAIQTAYLQSLLEQNKRFIEDFKKSPGQRVELSIPGEWPLTTQTVEAVSLSENHVLKDKHAKVSAESPPAVSLFLKGPLEQTRGAESTFVFYAHPLDVLKIDGKSVLGQTGSFTGSLELRAGEVRIQAQSAHLVIDEARIRITLRD